MSSSFGTTLCRKIVVQMVDTNSKIITNFDDEASQAIVDKERGDVTIPVPDAAADQQIILPGAAVDFLLVHVDQDMSIKLSGTGNTPITIKKDGVFLLTGDAISSLHVSNASGFDGVVRVISANTQ